MSTTATASRDKALDQVTRSWSDIAVARFLDLELDPTFTGEDIRLGLIEGGLEPPHHHNAWGAFTMRLVRDGYITPTGDYTNMRGPKSHARITRLYRHKV